MIFQSTLSVRRATHHRFDSARPSFISIHALREESDLESGLVILWIFISIHALREESDQRIVGDAKTAGDISIHALREESDCVVAALTVPFWISIHALREESDMNWP